MTFDPSRWIRFQWADTPVWICPDRPSWFVPTSAGDKLLQQVASGSSDYNLESLAFLQRLPESYKDNYEGRHALLSDTPVLSELWMHITDRCNLACRHCMFSSGPDAVRELSLSQLNRHLEDAAKQGCRLFALTGGEPFVHPDFKALIENILSIPDSRIAILTNGLLLEKRFLSSWPRKRIHLQISIDGRPEHHESLRGRGTFERVEQQLNWLRQEDWPFTLSCCVTSDNANDLTWFVEYAAEQGAAAVHFMWHFVRGRGDGEQHIDPIKLLDPVLKAIKRSEELGIIIDNIESLKGQIFAPPGTIYDGSSAGWEAAAIGPDNQLYPSAATIGLKELATGLEKGLQYAWENSLVLKSIRQTSVKTLSNPWRYLLGGGDLDHCYHNNGSFVGADPYQPLLENLVLHLISQAAGRLPEPEGVAICLKMGELLVSCGAHGAVAVCHTNCLLSLDGSTDSRSQVGAYYAEAVGDKRIEILNPVNYENSLIEHIPAAYRFRGYGCGSPVMDAEIKAGERVVDLGCGSGVECFIAARLVGAKGLVTGVDMLDPMLELACKGADEVRNALGYDNLLFKKGFLEQLPLEDNESDLVVSNCVLNLSVDKRSVFSEILRILKPGGRLVAADVVCETEPDASILNDDTLRGECISGAMTQKDLLGILEETGFTGFRVIKRLPYRVVRGHPFFSLTFSVQKKALSLPQTEDSQQVVRVIYPGPAAGLLTASGLWLRPGQTVSIQKSEAELLGEQLWQLDEDGFVTNVAIEAGANCALPPESKVTAPKPLTSWHDSGCLVCGVPLIYHAIEKQAVCHFCGRTLAANACCENGHFVCDRCHTGDALELIEHICLNTKETEPVDLFQEIRKHPAIPMHGPQYHALVPAVLLACIRNAGHPVTHEQLRSSIQRGGEIIGGSCAFVGICGAATGVGIVFSLLLEANPLKASARQTVQRIVKELLEEIAAYEAARCCQRDSWIALRTGMRIASELLNLNLPEVKPFACSQMARNKECLGMECPLWP